MTTPDDPIHIISLGAGVQSSTMALMAALDIIGPMPTCAIFADTQDEPKQVYDWLNWLKPNLPFPVHEASHGNLVADSTVTRTSKKSGKTYQRSIIPFYILGATGKPGILQRRCTADYKVKVIVRGARGEVASKFTAWRRLHKDAVKALGGYRKLLKETKRAKIVPPHYPLWAWEECQDDPLVIQWIGISTDEAVRMKPSSEPWILHRWPLIEQGMSRAGCLDWMARNGYPEPPRSACKRCPYHSDAEWIRLRDESPADFAEVVAWEKKAQAGYAEDEVSTGVPFLHNSRVPLDQVVFDPNKGKQNFVNECEGMCGV